MKTKSVQIHCDVYCKWNGNDTRYRLYVNDELFAERTWLWKDEYLEELLQISAPAGTYKIKYELVPPFTGNIKVKKYVIEYGPAGTETLKGDILWIGYAST
jgi:hypothetical protein